MTTPLIHTAIGLLICACVLLAPHASPGNGIRASIAFSLMAGLSIATAAYLELIA
ncbi:hypothetical protein D3C78_1166380 [compost metagenome]